MAAHAHGEGAEGETEQPAKRPDRPAPERAAPERPAERPAERPTERISEQSTERRVERRRRVDVAEIRGAVCRVLAGIVRWVGLLFAVVLVLHVVLVIGEANPTNGITTFVKSWADFVALGFQDLFAPTDPKLRVLVNYGTAAVFWLVVSSIVASLIRRLGGEKAT